MRVNRRQILSEQASTRLSLKLIDYFEERKIEEYVEILRAISFEIRNILLDMEPEVKRGKTHSALQDLIVEHKAEYGLTDIELLQSLNSYSSDCLRWMLRWERHGSYDTPAGLDKE